jgi:hypothetical protein
MNGEVFTPLIRLEVLSLDSNHCISQNFKYDALTDAPKIISGFCLVAEDFEVCEADLATCNEAVKVNQVACQSQVCP